MSQVEEALKAAKETKALWIGSGFLSRVSELFKEQFPEKKAVIIADNNTYKVAGKYVEQFINSANIAQEAPFIFTDPELYAEYTYVDILTDFLKDKDVIPVAVGSGTINDLTKLSSHLTGRQYLCVATAASMDGYTAFGASITANGAKQTFNCPAPQACLADLDIISKAPSEMTASGYADLFAKIPAGADWILADMLNVEPIDGQAWNIVQGGLHNALSDPEGVRKGQTGSISKLIEGLMLGGFAMQWSQTSRPASGAEHQFSHLWNMEHHLNNGEHISHGFQVSIGSIAITAFYEQLLKTPIEKLDIEAACNAWPTPEESDHKALDIYKGTDFPDIGLKETRAKYIDKNQLADQLKLLVEKWPEMKSRLEQQLVPYKEAKMRLKTVGAPVEPEEIGLSRERLRETFIRAQFIRRRFTVLDLAVRTNYMDRWLDGLFGKGGIWEINQ
ncbi:MAG: sn-glycerol-1-phosphate dehydrogenase [Bacteroidales bacterium]|jgi:glycerol-1-phosphate dehydrogenase [NAD(P)+]|nr:sn-glycerol-1-phosphate dehydrogenase [Bacteroidales bacterium]